MQVPLLCHVPLALHVCVSMPVLQLPQATGLVWPEAHCTHAPFRHTGFEPEQADPLSCHPVPVPLHCCGCAPLQPKAFGVQTPPSPPLLEPESAPLLEPASAPLLDPVSTLAGESPVTSLVASCPPPSEPPVASGAIESEDASDPATSLGESIPKTCAHPAATRHPAATPRPTRPTQKLPVNRSTRPSNPTLAAGALDDGAVRNSTAPPITAAAPAPRNTVDRFASLYASL